MHANLKLWQKSLFPCLAHVPPNYSKQKKMIVNQSSPYTKLAIYSLDSLQTVRPGKVGLPKYSILEDVQHVTVNAGNHTIVRHNTL